MAATYLAKIGVMGRIGRFISTGQASFSHDDKVVCRTDRGVEIGSILCAIEEFDSVNIAADGTVLRVLSTEDKLLQTRIEKFRDRAFSACQKLLLECGLNAILVDVEHLFDGNSLYFYFLGEVPDEVHQLTSELAETYEKKVRFKKFSETMANGCGPDCGTGESKCSSNGCSSCALSGSCGSKN